MRHGNGYRKLGREDSHRKSMLRNLMTSLVTHGAIVTTVPRAKELKRVVDRLITRAKKKDLAAVRHVASVLFTKEAQSLLFRTRLSELSDRNSGYTRILKLGRRQGDGAESCRIEFVSYQPKLA